MKRWEKIDICLLCDHRREFCIGRACYNAVWKNHLASCFDSKSYFEGILQGDSEESLEELFLMAKEASS